MLNEFSRTELLIGKEAMQRLYGARVAVFGIGGVGGYVVEALARSGVGAFDLIDDDKVCLTNINRQIIATRKTIGKYKVDVMEERVHSINMGSGTGTISGLTGHADLSGSDTQLRLSEHVHFLKRR